MSSLATSALSKKRLEEANKRKTMKNRPPSPYVAPPSAAPLPVMHPDYPEFPLHKKKHPSGMTKPVRELFAKAEKADLTPSVQKLFAQAKKEDMAPSVQKLFAEAKSKQVKKGGKKSRKSRKMRKSRKSRKSRKH